MNYKETLSEILSLCADNETSPELVDKIEKLCADALDETPDQIAPSPVQGDEKFYAVEYAGFWNIQKQPGYESPESGTNILDAEQVGQEAAEYYANLIAKLLNEHYGTIN